MGKRRASRVPENFSLRSEQKSASTRLCHLLRQPEGHQACAGCSGLFASCFRMVPHRSWCQALTLRCFRAFDHVPGGPGMATYTAFRLAPWQPRSIWLKAGLCYVTRMALRYRPTSIYELQHGGNIIYEPWRSTETRGVSQRWSHRFPHQILPGSRTVLVVSGSPLVIFQAAVWAPPPAPTKLTGTFLCHLLAV